MNFHRPIVHMTCVIEGNGALFNEKGEKQPLKAGDFALVNPEGLTPENRVRRASS
jgi:hypothetical protein